MGDPLAQARYVASSVRIRQITSLAQLQSSDDLRLQPIKIESHVCVVGTLALPYAFFIQFLPLFLFIVFQDNR